MKKNTFFLKIMLLAGISIFPACEKLPTDTDYIAVEQVKTLTLNRFEGRWHTGYWGDWANTDVTLYENFNFCIRIGFDGNLCMRPYTQGSGKWNYQDNGFAEIFSIGRVNSLSEITQNFNGDLGGQREVGLVENGGYVIAHQETPETQRYLIRLFLKSYKKNADGVVTSITLEYQLYTPNATPALIAGTLCCSQTVPYMITPAQISLTGTSGGYGNYSYMFQSSADNGVIWSSSTNWQPTAIYAPHYNEYGKYRVIVRDNAEGKQQIEAISNEIEIKDIVPLSTITIKIGNEKPLIRDDIYIKCWSWKVGVAYYTDVIALYGVGIVGSLSEITEKRTEAANTFSNSEPIELNQGYVIVYQFNGVREYIRMRVIDIIGDSITFEYEGF
ncbi:MAG: hypothetical protein LBN95_10475 [Prevotellaceae bacterium]|jgi:hypothetical protein|nr:hypothetical protein [Prevotellaceae bacterium]